MASHDVLIIMENGDISRLLRSKIKFHRQSDYINEKEERIKNNKAGFLQRTKIIPSIDQ